MLKSGNVFIVVDKNVQLYNVAQDRVIDDAVNKHRISSNKRALVAEIVSAIDDENTIVAAGQRKTPVSIVNDSYCEELDLLYFILIGKFGYKAEREVAITPLCYFNQRLLNFNQSFASDSDYIFLLGLFASCTIYAHQLIFCNTENKTRSTDSYIN